MPINEPWFLVVGYIVFFLFTGGIVVLGKVLNSKFGVSDTVSRKIVHIVSCGEWVIMQLFFGCSVHWLILNGISAVLLGILMFTPALKNFANDDADKSYGMFYFALGTFCVACIIYFFDQTMYLYAGIVYFCLTIGDGMAPLVAKWTKKFNPEIRQGKSLFGCLAVFVFSFLSAMAFKLIFHLEELDWFFLVTLAAAVTVIEFYGFKGLDNLFIEFGTFGYLALYHFGLVQLSFEVTVLLSLALALVALKLGVLSVSGGIGGLIYFLGIAFFSEGFMMVVFSLVLFLLASLVSRLTVKAFNKKTGNHKAKSKRTGIQILAAGIAALGCMIANYFTKNQIFLWLALLALTEQLADSLAGDIGRLTNGKNIDIIRFKAVDKGISGGVSLLGLAIALSSSFIILLIPIAFQSIAWVPFAVIGGLAFFGTIIDSILGSLLQVLYRCEVCGTLTEEKEHCEKPTAKIKGISFVNNVMVNILTSVITLGIGVIPMLFL